MEISTCLLFIQQMIIHNILQVEMKIVKQDCDNMQTKTLLNSYSIIQKQQIFIISSSLVECRS